MHDGHLEASGHTTGSKVGDLVLISIRLLEKRRINMIQCDSRRRKRSLLQMLVVHILKCIHFIDCYGL